jgi:hypothetical protein
MALAAPAAHRGDIAMALEELGRRLHPAFDQLAIAIDELRVLEIRREAKEAAEAGVARPGGGKRQLRVEADERHAELARDLRRAVGGPGVDVDQRGRGAQRRGEAAAQPLAFVAADHHHADSRLHRHGPR